MRILVSRDVGWSGLIVLEEGNDERKFYGRLCYLLDRVMRGEQAGEPGGQVIVECFLWVLLTRTLSVAFCLDRNGG